MNDELTFWGCVYVQTYCFLSITYLLEKARFLVMFRQESVPFLAHTFLYS